MKFKIGDKVLCMNSDFEKKYQSQNFQMEKKYIQSGTIVMFGIWFI